MSGGKLENIIYHEISYALTGIFFDVHNELGRYCREKQYCDVIEKLLIEKGIKYEKELIFKSENDLLKDGSNRADFIIENKIIVEVKAVRFIGKSEYYQMQRYLQAFGKKLGILVNFNQKYIKPKRIINSHAKE